MTGEDLERLEELEEMAESGELDKEEDPDTWEELQDLRAERRTEKHTEKRLAKWKKAKKVLYVSLRDPDPDNDISFYVYDRAGFEAVTRRELWPDEIISAVTVMEVDPKTVGEVVWQDYNECFYSVADMEQWKAIQQEQDEKWERERAEESAAYQREWERAEKRSIVGDGNTQLATVQQVTAIERAGQIANVYAAAGAFADYAGRKAQNTLDAQRADLATFAEYLCDATGGQDCPTADQLQTDAAAWRGVTHGLVAGFVRWMLAAGFAVGTVNRKLSTVRVYAKLAAQAKVIAADESTLIRGVAGYGGKEGKRQDEKRAADGIVTRKGAKKAQHVELHADQVKSLKAQPDTPQGRRDAVIMCLLLDHGLRVGELALLQVTAFDLKAGTFTFYRPKVDKTQTHKMGLDTLRAVSAWLHTDAPAIGALLRCSRKGGKQKTDAGGRVHGNGKLTNAGMSERAITERVHDLGEAVGIAGLSAHDCRHSWATRAAKAGTDTFALRDAGGWSSLAMPSRYVEAAAIANERVKL